MPRIGEFQRYTILRKLLEGRSHREVATESGVSESAVLSIWQGFGEGRLPSFRRFQPYAEALREAATGLKGAGLSAVDAALALKVAQTLARLGVAPGQMEEYTRLSERLAGDSSTAVEVVRAALELQRLERETGLDHRSLVQRARDLAERRQRLEAEVADLEARHAQAQAVQVEVEGLWQELEGLRRRRDRLLAEVTQWQQEEQDLARRVSDLQAQAQGAQAQMSAWQGTAQALAALALTPADLQAFVERMAKVAQGHGVSAAEAQVWLLHALEQLDQGQAVDAIAERRRQELRQVEAEIEARQAQLGELQGTLAGVEQERQRLEGEVGALSERARSAVQKAGQEAAAAVHEGAQTLRGQLDTLLQQALDLANKTAEIEVELRSREWLNHLLALVEGRPGLEPQRVKGLALALMPPFGTWLEQHKDTAPSGAREPLERLVRAFKEWQG
ncbi:MAG: hypothetical protein HY683_04605 [Chloroflexi bacterium]|nr:hypothetical protein [Chloroflexota bacterium]